MSSATNHTKCKHNPTIKKNVYVYIDIQNIIKEIRCCPLFLCMHINIELHTFKKNDKATDIEYNRILYRNCAIIRYQG